MSDEFKREHRYIVLKVKDLKNVDKPEQYALREVLDRIDSEMPQRQYVVVESDWPEYETKLAEAQAEAMRLRDAIELTVKENGHLADGDVCTLRRLTLALEHPSDTPALDAVTAPLEAKIAELEGALDPALDDMGEAGRSVCPACKEWMVKVLANKSPSSALDRAIRQAKVEALEEAADAFELVNKRTNVGVWNGDAVTGKLRRMADERRNAP